MYGFMEWLWIASAICVGGLCAGVGIVGASWLGRYLARLWAEKKMRKTIAEFDALEEDIII